MADNDDKIKISELDPALTLDNTSETVVNKQVSGSWATFKMTIATLAAHILEAFSSSSLMTTNKTVVGAINELQQGGGGSSTLAGLTDVEITSPSNNQVLMYNGSSQKWENGSGSSSSGHNYSTSEQVVGTWIDGSILYEKTYIFTNQSYSGDVNVPISLPPVNAMWIESAWCINSENSYLPLPYVHRDSGYSIGIFIYPPQSYIGLRGGSTAYPIRDLYVTLRYTKAST